MAKQQLWNRALVHFLVGLLSLITAYAAVVPVNNGTDFVAGVAQFCKTGGDLVLTLSTNISIDQSIPFPSGGALSCVQPGRLVLDGASSSGQTAVLDAAMRSDLTLPWNSQTPTLVWQNLILINLCTESLVWNPLQSIYVNSASNTWLLPRSRSVHSHSRYNTTIYVPRSEVLGMVYWNMMYWAPFDAFAAVKAVLLQFAPPANSRVSRVSAHSVTFDYFELAGGIDSNVTVSSTSNPGAPPEFRLPSVNNGTLMPSRYCSGPAVSGPLLRPDEVAANVSVFPQWLVDTSSGLQDALVQIAGFSLNLKPGSPPPFLGIVANVSLASSGGINIRSDMLLHGPFNQVPGFIVPVALDFGQQSVGILNMGAGAVLYLQKIILTGLAVMPLDGTANYNSSLPVWAIKAYSGQLFQADNITLVVSRADFAALLSAALRGSRWKTGASATLPLFSQIATFSVSPDSPPTRSAITLSAYNGWGLNATNIIFLPQGGPLLASDPLPDQSSSSNSNSKAVAIGVGVGVGVGGALLLAGLLFGLLLWRRKRAAEQAEREAVYEKEMQQKDAAERGFQRQSAGDPGVIGRSSAGALGGTGGGGIHQSASRSAIHKAVIQAAEAISQGTPPAMLLATGGTDMSNATGSPAEGQQAAGGYPVGGSPMTGGSPDGSSAAGNEPAGVGAVVATPGATTLQQAAATAAAAAAITAGGARFSSITNPSTGTGYATPLTPATAFLTAGGPAGNTTAALMASPAVQAEMMQNGNAAGGTPSSGATGTASSGTISGTMDPVKQMQQRSGLAKLDGDKVVLHSVIGKGAWGTVYKGTWRGMTVAVKTVLFSEREDGDSKLPHERAIMEAAVCTSVAHRNVVSTYHYDIKPVRTVDDQDDGLHVEVANAAAPMGTTDWKLFLVQEWCQSTLGQALRSWLLHKKETREPLLDLLLGLLIDVAQGVLYLHDRQIIHGDLKPENVMLKTDSSAPIGVVAKITDFGLSTTLNPTQTHVSNYTSGTPYYAAQEVTAQGRTTKASDTYSFGVLMWEGFNCQPPWIKIGGEYQPNTRFPTFPSAAPPPFVNLVNKCLATDPKTRPIFSHILTELQAMLDAWQKGYDSLELAPPATTTTSVHGNGGTTTTHHSPGPSPQQQVTKAAHQRQQQHHKPSAAAPPAAARQGSPLQPQQQRQQQPPKQVAVGDVLPPPAHQPQAAAPAVSAQVQPGVAVGGGQPLANAKHGGEGAAAAAAGGYVEGYGRPGSRGGPGSHAAQALSEFVAKGQGREPEHLSQARTMAAAAAAGNGGGQ